MADVTLSSATRSNLLSLQRTTSLINQTQDRLSTGREVNSAVDDALAFFKSRNLSNRASDLASIKDNITEGISIVETAVKSLESMEDVLKQMQATAEAAKAVQGTDADANSERKALASDFDDLRDQLNYLVEDADYNGVNLISGTSNSNLEVVFSEQSDSRMLTVETVELTAGSATTSGTLGTNANGLGIDKAGTGSWANLTGANSVESSLDQIDAALDTVRDYARQFGSQAALLEIRKDFTENMINTLESGASDLVNADMNAESANMLSLQTRQQLGTISLSIAQQSEQSVLRLF